MKTSITVREFARLSTDRVAAPSLDSAHVSSSAFNWLCRASSSFGMSGTSLVQLVDQRALRLKSYVGVVETPCATRIEILPKIFDPADDEARSRALLRRMISANLDIPALDISEAMLQRFDTPLSEWVMGRFLTALNHLIKRGIRFDYARIEESERFLRGQLNVARQVRQPPGRQHIFETRHDVFVPDRPENRLLRRALEQVAASAQTATNWRLAQELRTLMRDVPSSKDVPGDFIVWGSDRLMAHYRPIRPWCELVLYLSMPYSLAGEWHGISLLFPMEKLFERFVAAWLRRTVTPGVRVQAQAKSEFLCVHQGVPMFRLEPDLFVESDGQRWILDTKWKRLNEQDRANNYGLIQADVYQLFAYGMKYLSRSGGQLVLVYPRTRYFEEPLPVFDLGHGLALHVLPFDLTDEALVGAELAGLPILEQALLPSA